MFYKFLKQLESVKYLTLLCLPINLYAASFGQLESLIRSIPHMREFTGSEIEVCRGEQNVGRGAFARVSRGMLRIAGSPEEEVALKPINVAQVVETLVDQGQHRSYINSEDIEAGFYFEASCLIRVSEDCANIVKFYGIYQEGEDFYFVMKLYQRTLKEQIAVTTSPDQRLRYAIDIIHGLKYLHEKGFVHRDLKPDNFFIDEHDRVVIGDFGVSISENTGRTRFIELGVQSRKYKSPEAVLHWQKIPEKSDDIYAFGLVLWQLVERQEAFNEYSWQWIKGLMDANEEQFPLEMKEAYAQIKSYEPTQRNDALSPLEEINKKPDWERILLQLIHDSLPRKTSTNPSSALENLIQQCLSNNPNSRPSALDIENQLIACLSLEQQDRIREEQSQNDNARRSEWNSLFNPQNTQIIVPEGTISNDNRNCTAKNMEYLLLYQNQLNEALQYLDIRDFSDTDIDRFVEWLPAQSMTQNSIKEIKTGSREHRIKVRTCLNGIGVTPALLLK